MTESEILEQRRQARAEKHLIDLGLIDLQQKAANVLLDPLRGEQARQKALQQVEKWDRGHLCNPRYIQAWRSILNLPVASMQAAILREDEEGVSLRQNSPFGFLMDRAA